MQPYQSEYASPPPQPAPVTPPVPAGPPAGAGAHGAGFAAVAARVDANIVLPPAARGYRTINWLIDRTLSYYYGLVFGVAWILLYSLLIKPRLILPTWAEYATIVAAWASAVGLYYVLFEWWLGRTFGKALTATQVVSTAGQRPSLAAIVGRTFARLIPFEELMVFGADKRALHDKLSGTLVVSARSLPAVDRRNGWPFRTVAVFAILPIGGLTVAYPAYTFLTGGERIELSRNIPSDLKLSAVERMPDEQRDYYRLTLRGNDRTVQLTRLIAGYNFDTKSDCIYTKPTAQGLLSAKIDPGLTCNVLTKVGTFTTVRKVVRSQATTASDALVPDYIIERPPYEFAVKATSGTMTDQEAVALATNLQKYTYSELKALAKRNVGPEQTIRVNTTPIPTPTVTPTPTPIPSPAATATPTPTPNLPSYLVVKEAGLKIPLTAGIADLTYVYAPASYPDALGRIQLSTSSISVFGGGTCGMSNEPLGAYVVFRSPQSGFGGAQLVATINGTYVYYANPQYACGNTSEERAKVTSLIEPVLAAVKRAQPAQ